ncbi:MAG: dephospho-CoA kinase [Sphingomonadaceae bacterium]|uniref:dephospho-CoA kinase n=1 Tax=Thermaurantiacus sp. TaxID=2820283 RepID=UPI00298EF887|nr:dephospho-CoA kinase [Thermaurantiacus sp.]MCS6987666.1 dephospho-CoA kinase [Sphingomonadaceae bacterium]MDW8415267.1 dephospho-CoA kinase [Thermaurantiacus sp.]
MARRPFRIGLTGSIGMGKSTVARMFRHLGLPVFDADAAVHAAQGPGGEAVNAIEAAFPGTTGPQGVDRQKLAEAVFGRPEALRRLEAIVHPAVARRQARFLRRHRSKPAVVLDIPLLLEGPGWRSVDLVAVVSAPARVQRARVLARPGMTPERLERVLAHQLPDARKRALADVVIETGRGRLPTFRTVRFLARLARAGR